jgi:hypothetical protein
MGTVPIENSLIFIVPSQIVALIWKRRIVCGSNKGHFLIREFFYHACFRLGKSGLYCSKSD